MTKVFVALLCLLSSVATAWGEPVQFKERCLADLVSQTPAILASQDRATGRFGTGIWLVTDQNVMLPLAAVWSTRGKSNPHYHDAKVLEAIESAGDALIADASPDGRWEFRKKDGSTWGQIYMPWTYSRWVRSFAIIRDAMPVERRTRWEKALNRGYAGIAQQIAANPSPNNIAAHHAMGLYVAGDVLGHPEWKTLARDVLRKVAKEQQPDGYWSEHQGPVVNYGFVYVDAIGTYTAVSHDEEFLPQLRKAAIFHSHFTYPDGTDVETIDERNPYHGTVRMPNVGFSFSPEGRTYLARQMGHFKELPVDEAASLLLYGQEGEGIGAANDKDFDYEIDNGSAAVHRRGPWTVVLSALTSPVADSRWFQDRQNFVSIFRDGVGLIVGGGNTKLQPGWSNFTAGNVAGVFHKAGDENPKFLPLSDVVYVPSEAKLLAGSDLGLELQYGKYRGSIRVNIKDAIHAEIVIEGDRALTAHVTLLPKMGATVQSSTGKSAQLTGAPWAWQSNPLGLQFDYSGIRWQVSPGDVSLRWPVLPFNPYRKDGSSLPEEGRLVLDIPMKETASRVAIEVRPELK